MFLEHFFFWITAIHPICRFPFVSIFRSSFLFFFISFKCILTNSFALSFWEQNLNFPLIFLCVCMCVYLSVYHLHIGVYRAQKAVSDLLELECPVFFEPPDVGSGNWTWGKQEQCALYSAEPFSTPRIEVLLFTELPVHSSIATKKSLGLKWRLTALQNKTLVHSVRTGSKW